MSLLHKPDWEDTKERFRAWWAREPMGRCAIWVQSPRDGAAEEEPPTAPEDPVRRWTDLDYIIALNDYTHRRLFYGGESFPIWTGGYPGHTAIPTYLGCHVELDMDTGWWEPFLTGDDWDPEALRIDENGRYYRFTLDLLHTAVREAKGKAIPSTGAFGGTGDTLAAVRGTNELLFDVVERPDLVRRTEMHLVRQWIDVYQTLYDILSPVAEGSCGWFRLWAPGKFYAVQNDFSYMISTDMYRDIFLRALEVQLEYLDYTIYHVDGTEAFRHVPTLCELPDLHALQISPGAGKPNPLHYMDVLKHCQSAGKNVHISLPASEVETALTELSSRGLFISTSTRSEEEARALLRMAERVSHD